MRPALPSSFPRPRPAWLGAVAVVAAVALLPVAGSADAAAPVLRKALYKGTVTDPDGDPETYAVTIRVSAKTLRKKRRAGRITYRAAENEQTGAYPLNCKGTLTYRGRRGKRFRFAETIDGGASAQCVSGGTVTLTRLSSRRLTYAWTIAGIDRPAPTGALAR